MTNPNENANLPTNAADDYAEPDYTRSGGFKKKKWHKMADPGIYQFRLLPPLHSLHPKKQISKYYATHGGFKNSRNFSPKFICVEEKDRETKVITVHCPVCDLVASREAQYKEMEKNPRVTKEQRAAFRNQYIMPFQAEKKYYFNAIDANGGYGILPLPYKAFQSVDTLLKAESKNGFSLASVKGAYVSITKSAAYKGDPQTSYSAALAMSGTGKDRQVKEHIITIPRAELEDANADLGDLYKVLSVESVARLAAAKTKEEIATLMDELFPSNQSSSPEATEDAGVAGTTLAPTSEAPATYSEPTAAPASAAVSSIKAPAPATTVAPTPAAAPAQAANTMSDEEFLQQFAAK